MEEIRKQAKKVHYRRLLYYSAQQHLQEEEEYLLTLIRQEIIDGKLLAPFNFIWTHTGCLAADFTPRIKKLEELMALWDDRWFPLSHSLFLFLDFDCTYIEIERGSGVGLLPGEYLRSLGICTWTSWHDMDKEIYNYFYDRHYGWINVDDDGSMMDENNE